VLILKLRVGGNLFGLKKIPQPNKGVKFAYWTCTNGGYKVSVMTKDVNTLDGLEFGSNKIHAHEGFSSVDMIRMEMIEKGRARDHTESVGKIVDDLEGDYLNQENLASVWWKRDNLDCCLNASAGA